MPTKFHDYNIVVMHVINIKYATGINNCAYQLMIAMNINNPHYSNKIRAGESVKNQDIINES